MTVERARVIEVDEQSGSLVARLGLPGEQMVERAFDTVIICSGASRSIRDNRLLDRLVDQGLARADDLNFGVWVDKFSRLIDAGGTVQGELFAFGPVTRGTFGEMTGAPDISRLIERVTPVLQRWPPRSCPMNRQEQFVALAALMSCRIIDLPRCLARGRPCLLVGPPPPVRIDRRSLGRQSGQKLGRQAEPERDHQEHAETGEHLQRLGWIDFIRIVSIETALLRMVL
ncbi:MAG TPA: hypothetical protein VGG86_01065, partial [Roseiarcus sp.]